MAAAVGDCSGAYRHVPAAGCGVGRHNSALDRTAGVDAVEAKAIVADPCQWFGIVVPPGSAATCVASVGWHTATFGPSVHSHGNGTLGARHARTCCWDAGLCWRASADGRDADRRDSTLSAKTGLECWRVAAPGFADWAAGGQISFTDRVAIEGGNVAAVVDRAAVCRDQSGEREAMMFKTATTQKELRNAIEIKD